MFIQYRNISQYIVSLPLYRDTYRNARFLPIHTPNKAVRDFELGQEVLARDYKGEKWTPGKIATRTGPLMYTVDVGKQTWRRHVDPILDAQPKCDIAPSPDTSPTDPDTATERSMDLLANRFSF